METHRYISINVNVEVLKQKTILQKALFSYFWRARKTVENIITLCDVTH